MKVTLVLFLIMGLVLIDGCGRKEEKQPAVKEAEEILPRKIIPEKGGEKTTVKKGDIVKVDYIGTLRDGTTSITL